MPASQFKFSVWQLSVQFRSWRPFLLHAPRSWLSRTHVFPATQRSRPSAFASPTVCLPTTKTQGALAACRSRLPKLYCQVAPLFGSALQSCLSRGRLRSFLCWLLRLARVGRLSVRIGPKCGGSRARFSYSSAMRTSSGVPPNPSLKRSANGMPPGLGHGCTHIFHGPGLASYRRHSA
jgi:hypothetical protein